MSGAPPRRIKSAERTLALFELFSREQQPFTVGHIARALAIPQPSVSMLLRNLQDQGYLEYDAVTRTFAPSIRVALLGAWVDRRFSQAGEIGARLSELQIRIGETAFIGIQNGASAQYVLSQYADHPDRLEVVSGEFRSLTCSAMGRALLCLRPDDEILRWVRRCNAESTEDRFKVRETEFLQRIQTYRLQGFAETAGDVTAGAGAFAICVRSPMGGSALAVGLGGPLERILPRRSEMTQALLEFKRSYDAAMATGTDELDRAAPMHM